MSSEAKKRPDDSLLIVHDDTHGAPRESTTPWRVLVVDDDEDVHESTRFALRHARILDRPIELLHARSAAEARQRLAEAEDVAVALVDVVMETPDAGLTLIGDWRGAGYREMRIILRTGQPGYAPEMSVIAAYEIDDYRIKAELTQTRLLTVLTAAIRAYDQIRTISRSRAGLEMIVESATQLFQRTNLELFSRGVLTQIAGLLGIQPNGMICVNAPGTNDETDCRVVSAVGHFAEYIGKSMAEITDTTISGLLAEARKRSEPVLANGYMALHFRCGTDHELSALIEADTGIAEPDLALLKLFSTNIAVGFENLTLVERLDRLAYLDPVLDLPNLNAFEAKLQTGTGSGTRQGRIALLNVDSFPSVVAAHGRRIAHEFLDAVYRSLVQRGGSGLSMARIGDDTFALRGDPAILDEPLFSGTFAKPFRVDGIDITTAATTVILDLAEIDPDPVSIMQTASSALLHVKRTQRGKCVVYDTAMRADVERGIALQAALKQAIERNQGLSLHMQPKVDIATSRIVGGEALLRWRHGDEDISPAEFIPLAESAGLTQNLTEFVIRALGLWSAGRKDARPLPIAVNLSMIDLNNPGFSTRLLTRVAEAGLSPETIEFEVTEGIAMQDTPWPIQQVQALRDAGFRIALDDFGTGYSSLGQFQRLPIDILKIDRSFVASLEIPTARHSLAAIVIAMTEALDVECVAEGIETNEQKQALLFLGCTVGQGFLFGPSLPIEDFDRNIVWG
mgnify:CR=1 FL=1